MKDVSFCFATHQQEMVAEHFGISKDDLEKMQDWKVAEMLDDFIDEAYTSRQNG